MEIRNTVRAKSIGSCIYCGATDRLTDEHIIPLALGGRYILPKSSCDKCAEITKNFERRVLRGFMLDARTAGNYRTRRPKERPKFLTVQVERDGMFEHVPLDPKDHPAFLHLPLLALPGVLVGREHTIGLSVTGHQTLYFGKDPSEVTKALGVKTIRSTANWDLLSFARMLAKIGYSYAVSQFGLPPREEVPVLPFILGKADDASYWLGSEDFKLEIEDKNPIHVMGLRLAPDPSNGERQMLVALVKLFAPSGARGYGIVVHRPQDH